MNKRISLMYNHSLIKIYSQTLSQLFLLHKVEVTTQIMGTVCTRFSLLTDWPALLHVQWIQSLWKVTGSSNALGNACISITCIGLQIANQHCCRR